MISDSVSFKSVKRPSGKHRLVRVLLVEHDPNQKKVFTALLAGAGFDVLIADNGNEAMALLENKEVDCVICDFFLPAESNGGELLKRIRESERLCDIPILVLTVAPREMEMKILAQGADMYCHKLDATKRLVSQVRMLL